MAVRFIETHESRKVKISATGGGVTLEFVVVGTTDETELYIAILEFVPPYYDGFVRSDIDYECLGGPNWKVTIEYGATGAGGGDQPVGESPLGGDANPQPTQPVSTDDPLGGGYSFDTTGQTEHITQSIKTLSATYAGVGASPPDNQQAIGWTEDRVEGVDIYAPKLEFSRTVSRSTVSLKYVKRLRGLTGSVNNDTFYGFAAGEVLYLGASGQFTQGQGWSITHKFAVSLNISDDIEVSDDITIVANPAVNEGYSKKGWQYLWVGYAKDLVGNNVLPVPYAAYVEDVYPTQNFDLLEIS